MLKIVDQREILDTEIHLLIGNRVKRYLEASYNDIRRFDNDELVEIKDVCTILKDKTSVVYFNNHYEIDGDWRQIVIYERELDEDLEL